MIDATLKDRFLQYEFGQGLAARELLARGGKVLFGSIYPTNVPSYRAALRSHRVDIGGNYMVPIHR